MIDSEKNNVNSIDLSKMDGTDKVSTVVNLEAAVITKFRAINPGEDLNEVINFILDKKTFENQYMLKYNGKTHIRPDVLQKLKIVSDAIELLPNFPNIKQIQIKKIIHDKLGTLDYRTCNKYHKSITECLNSNPENKSSLNSVNCSCLVKAVHEKLAEKYR